MRLSNIGFGLSINGLSCESLYFCLSRSKSSHVSKSQREAVIRSSIDRLIAWLVGVDKTDSLEIKAGKTEEPSVLYLEFVGRTQDLRRTSSQDQN